MRDRVIQDLFEDTHVIEICRAIAKKVTYGCESDTEEPELEEDEGKVFQNILSML